MAAICVQLSEVVSAEVKNGTKAADNAETPQSPESTGKTPNRPKTQIRTPASPYGADGNRLQFATMKICKCVNTCYDKHMSGIINARFVMRV